MSVPKRVDNHALLASLKHPLRRRILRAMPDGKEMSPRELAEQLGEPLGTLSYHVRVLAGHGVLELVREKRVRGATQHFYRSSVTADWAQALLQESEWQTQDGGSRGEENGR